MSPLNQHAIKYYCTPEDYRRVAKEASAKGVSLSKATMDMIRQYFALREELATAFEAPGDLGDETTGKIIHTLLARTEERMAVTIERLEERLSEQQEQLMIMTAMLEQMYLGLVTHMPEVPEEMEEAAIASGKRRYMKWLKSVEKRLQQEV